MEFLFSLGLVFGFLFVPRVTLVVLLLTGAIIFP